MNEEETTLVKAQSRTYNTQRALEHSYNLIMNGKYTFELEREWNSILGIVPDDYCVAWQNTPKQMEDDNK